MSRPRRLDRAVADLAGLRESLRDAGNRERAGLFSCSGCVAWCCREGFNSMRATPLEAEAVVRLLEERGETAAAARRVREAIERWRLDREPADRPRTYRCPFLDASNRCGVHAAKPLGCATFTPVRDGGCDQDLPVLEEALDRVAALNDAALGEGRWEDLPLPVAVERALARRGHGPGRSASPTDDARGRYRRLPRVSKQSRQ